MILPIVNQSSEFFFTAGRSTKFAAKGMKYFPPHLTFVAALPWEVKSPNFVKSYKRVEPKNVYQVQ